MKATGIVRRIDDLGRIVIPKEIRRSFRIKEGDPLEIFTNADGEVIFKKYSPIGELSQFAGQYAEVLHKNGCSPVVITDNDHVVAAADSLLNAQLSMSDTEKQMENYTITSPISGTVIQKNVKAGDTVGTDTASSETLCTIYDLSYLEMTLNVDELEILSIKEGQTVTITADAISDRTFTGVVTSVSAAGTTTGGTTTYPVTIRIDDTGDLLPGMNATAEIEVSSAENALTIPNGAVVRGNYVLVTKDSPSAVNAVQDMTAPDGYVYVKITTGTSDNDSIEVTGGLQEGDTIAYDADAAEKQNASDSMEFIVGPGGSGGHGGGNGGPGGGGPGGGF